MENRHLMSSYPEPWISLHDTSIIESWYFLREKSSHCEHSIAKTSYVQPSSNSGLSSDHYQQVLIISDYRV